MSLMSPAGQSQREPAPAWRQVLRDAVRDVDELERLLGFPAGALESVAASTPGFPLLVPKGFVARMRKNDLDDPLLKQVLPLGAEHDAVAGFERDPLRESEIAEAGVLRKYAGRALLIASAACPVHCRYCFRRSFPYASQLAARESFGPAVAALRRSGDVKEVVLSGGDPLSLGNRKLGALLEALEDVAHLTTVRLHTRFPVMVPERVDAGLLDLLSRTTLRAVVVVHVNHANEVDAGVEQAMRRLKDSTHALFNQSVLLRGINDNAHALAELSERLFDCGVIPYYLHVLDRVAGAAHFAVPASVGARLVDELRRRLPGYLVPRLVAEIPGELSKTPILSSTRDMCDLRTMAQ